MLWFNLLVRPLVRAEFLAELPHDSPKEISFLASWFLFDRWTSLWDISFWKLISPRSECFGPFPDLAGFTVAEAHYHRFIRCVNPSE